MYSQFPNYLGAFYGKDVKIHKPTMNGSLFHNYKNYFSIVLLGIVDVNYKFIYTDVGSFGKESDSTIFEKTDFFKKLENNELNIRKCQLLPNTNTKMTFAFSLSSNVMRPFSGKVLSNKKRVFNYRLSHTRRHIESAFGILSNKWKLFHKPISANLNLSILLVKNLLFSS